MCFSFLVPIFSLLLFHLVLSGFEPVIFWLGQLLLSPHFMLSATGTNTCMKVGRTYFFCPNFGQVLYMKLTGCCWHSGIHSLMVSTVCFCFRVVSSIPMFDTALITCMFLLENFRTHLDGNKCFKGLFCVLFPYISLY